MFIGISALRPHFRPQEREPDWELRIWKLLLSPGFLLSFKMGPGGGDPRQQTSISMQGGEDFWGEERSPGRRRQAQG